MITTVKIQNISKKDYIETILHDYIAAGQVKIVSYINTIPDMLKIEHSESFDIECINGRFTTSLVDDRNEIAKTSMIITDTDLDYTHPQQTLYFGEYLYADKVHAHRRASTSLPYKEIDGTTAYTENIRACYTASSFNIIPGVSEGIVLNWGIGRCTLPNTDFSSQSVADIDPREEEFPQPEVPSFTLNSIEWEIGIDNSSDVSSNGAAPVKYQINELENPTPIEGIDTNILGCTSPTAANYNPYATVDDGSCVFGGCTDPAALNYNALATFDDGTCIMLNNVTPITSTIGSDNVTQSIQLEPNKFYYLGSYIDNDGLEISDFFHDCFRDENGNRISPGHAMVVFNDEETQGKYIPIVAIDSTQTDPDAFIYTALSQDRRTLSVQRGIQIKTVTQFPNNAPYITIEFRGSPFKLTTLVFNGNDFSRLAGNVERFFQYPGTKPIDIETLFANKLNYFQLIKDVNGDTYNSRYPENAKITTLEPGKSYIMIRTTNNLPTPDAASVSFSVPINNIDVEEEEEPDVLIEQDTQDFQFDTNVVTFPGDLANTTLFSSFIDISSYSMKYIFENFLYLDENTPITSYPENTRADVVAAYIAEVKAQDRTTTDVKRYIPASSVGSPDSIDTSKHCMVYSITYNVNSFYAPSAFTENFRRSAFLRIPGNIVNTGTISFKAGINYFALPGKNAATYTAIFGNHLDKIVYIKDIGTELSNGLISGGGYTINPELDFNSIGFLIPKKVYIVKTNQDFFINI